MTKALRSKRREGPQVETSRRPSGQKLKPSAEKNLCHFVESCHFRLRNKLLSARYSKFSLVLLSAFFVRGLLPFGSFWLQFGFIQSWDEDIEVIVPVLLEFTRIITSHKTEPCFSKG